MTFELPKLKFAYDALEPFIDTKTMEIHHTKHHQAYIDNLNKALEGEDVGEMDAIGILKNIDKISAAKRQAVINNGGGHVNHSFFWNILTSPESSKFELNNDKFKTLFNSTFKDVENFKNLFTERAMSLFGSGWCFLILDKDGKLSLKRHSFQNSPVSDGNIPLLGIDVWEHAYYLKYQNRRKDYIDAFWNVVDWKQVEENFSKAS